MAPEIFVSFVDFKSPHSEGYIPVNSFNLHIDGDINFVGNTSYGIRVEVPKELHPFIYEAQKDKNELPKQSLLCTELVLRKDRHGDVVDGATNMKIDNETYAANEEQGITQPDKKTVVMKEDVPFPVLFSVAPLD